MDMLEKAFSGSSSGSSISNKDDLLLMAIFKLLDYLKDIKEQQNESEDIHSRFDNLEMMMRPSGPRLIPSPS